MAYESFEKYYEDIKNSPEGIALPGETVYRFCAEMWARKHPGEPIPSMSGSSR
jgi:hypothetical protein